MKFIFDMRFWLLFILFASASLHASDSQQIENSFREVKCSQQLFSLLNQWSEKRTWSQHFSRVDSAKVYRSPTSRIGVWIEVGLYPDRKVIASKISSSSFLHVSWDNSCNPQMGNELRTLSDHPKNLPHGASVMTDRELEKILKQEDKGIIYAWSPYLPLSLDSAKAARRLSQRLNIAFIPVMDPDADWKLAFSRIDHSGLPRTMAQKIESLELIFRQLTLHYPSILVFKKGKFVSSFLPGYENSASYEKFIVEHLGSKP